MVVRTPSTFRSVRNAVGGERQGRRLASVDQENIHRKHRACYSLRVGPILAYALMWLVPAAAIDAQALFLPSIPPDFVTFYHFARLDQSVRFDSRQAIEKRWAPQYDEVIVDRVRSTRNRFLIGTAHGVKVQDIAIRGTVNLVNFYYDLRFRREYNERLGIWVHRGFSHMADELDLAVRPYLRRGYAIRLTGQSLGAAEALLLGMLLRKEGYDVVSVVTFGQPKVTNLAGAERFSSIPLLRVVNENDIVPLLPPVNLVYKEDPYVHFGQEINLLDGPYYCREQTGVTDRPLPPHMLEELSREQIRTFLKEHSIRSYVASIKRKLDGAREVPLSERDRYIPEVYRLY